MTEWEHRKRTELAAKLASLQADMAQWSSRTAAGQDLQKHFSQVQRLDEEFGPAVKRLALDAEDTTVADRWRSVEQMVQDLLSVWGYFRDKLAVRLVPDYGRYLAAADDLAWACYQPAQKAAVAERVIDKRAVREPPLVCLEDVGSPFSLVRGTDFEGELTASHRLTGASRELLRRLPVPVIAVPWFQLEHLPDALVIAHEVGHHVLGDLGLDEEAGRAIHESGAGVEESWTAEMFCDVFGTLCAGSAFASSLADFLRLAQVSDDATDLYPPTTTRLALCLGVLELPDVGSETASEALRGRWAHEGLELSDEERHRGRDIASAIATAPYQVIGKRLVDLDVFGAADEMSKDEQADELLAKRPTTTTDPRVLFAAASTAFTQAPDTYREREVGTSVLAAAHDIREPGVRWRVGHDSSAPGAAGQRAGQQTSEQQSSAIYDLLDRLSSDS
jgi:hypothetical protein